MQIIGIRNITNVNEKKIKNTAWCSHLEALSNLEHHWGTYHHKQGGL